jgi:magnesium-transporting ATPase (P-type)
MSKKSELDRIREEAEAKQRGVMWPDMLRQSRSIDGFLWNGDRKATPVQRAALVLYSLMFLFVVFLSIVIWIKNDYWVIRAFAVFMGTVSGIFAVRFARNMFLR